MANQGSGGAFEISQRMTALIGWGGTVLLTRGCMTKQLIPLSLGRGSQEIEMLILKRSAISLQNARST